MLYILSFGITIHASYTYRYRIQSAIRYTSCYRTYDRALLMCNTRYVICGLPHVAPLVTHSVITSVSLSFHSIIPYIHTSRAIRGALNVRKVSVLTRSSIYSTDTRLQQPPQSSLVLILSYTVSI